MSRGRRLSDKPQKILIYGYGNPGRQDDGLGIRFISELECWLKQNIMDNISLDSNYQLNIEDALALSEADIAIFVDASTETIEDFVLTKVEPCDKVEFTMHAVSPAFILSLCRDLYKTAPKTYLLHIKGYEWAMQEGLSEKAGCNLNLALAFIQSILKEPEQITRIPELSSV